MRRLPYHAWLLNAILAMPLPIPLTLHDGDTGDAQVFVTTSTPHGFDYRCKEWELEEKRDGHRIELQVLGLLTHGGATHSCAMAMDPVPIESRMAALTRPGIYTLEFSRAWPGSTSGAGTVPPDQYRLEVTDGSISFEPEGKPTFTNASNPGKFLRVPEDWLWLDVEFMDTPSRAKLGLARDELLKSVTALGARAFEPTEGSYLFGSVARKLPEKSPRQDQHDRIDESYFFHYTGNFAPLTELMRKYARHTRAAPGKPYMAVWTHTRTQVSSTYLYAN